MVDLRPRVRRRWRHPRQAPSASTPNVVMKRRVLEFSVPRKRVRPVPTWTLPCEIMRRTCIITGRRTETALRISSGFLAASATTMISRAVLISGRARPRALHCLGARRCSRTRRIRAQSLISSSTPTSRLKFRACSLRSFSRLPWAEFHLRMFQILKHVTCTR